MNPERRKQLIAMLLDGMHNGEIAKAFGVKPRTVKAWMHQLFKEFEIEGGVKRVKLITHLYRLKRMHEMAELLSPLLDSPREKKQ